MPSMALRFMPSVAIRVTTGKRCKKKRQTDFRKHDELAFIEDELNFYRLISVLELDFAVCLQSFSR